MRTKQSVLMAQPNYQYGNNVFTPYSVGSLQAYAQTCPEISEGFSFEPPLFARTNPIEVLRQIESPAVACFSCYLWNWEYNKMLAQAIRAAFPDCLIIFGGTHVPNASEGFFVEHPYVDLLVHHEGELTFATVLQQFLSGRPDYTKVPGLSVRVENTITVKTTPASRIKDLSRLPSPYLSGIFDFLLGRSLVLNASQETNRGCPYKCTFCDWGGNTYDQIAIMPEERILEEFEWFGKNGVEYIFNCDANYGILPRDLSLTEKMVAISRKYGGYPAKFRMCTAKNSNDKIFNISKILNDAGMSKGATLSFQSMDEHTLEIVRRSNIKLDIFSKLMNRYRQAGIPTYTELIMGMPGESYQSSKRGIDALIDGQDDAVNIYVYVCSVLPNSEMSAVAYVREHGIKSVRMPILLAHSTPEPESLAEYQEVVVETTTMSQPEWQRTYLFYWAVQTFHCLGLLQHIAIVCRKQFGIRYSDFYEQLIEHFAKRPKTLVGEQIALVRDIVEQAMTGGRLDLVLPKFGEIYWPLEEASFLNLVTNKERFYQEIRSFLGRLTGQSGQPVADELLDDLVLYQSALIKDPYVSESLVELRYDLRGYFSQLGEASVVPHLNKPVKLMIKADRKFDGDLVTYAREIVWYGRKGGSFHHANVSG